MKDLAKKVYAKMTSHANYSQMNGIEKDWFLKCIEDGLIEAQQQVNSVDLASVVNWLPFKREFADQYKQLAESGRLIKLYDDGTIIRHGEDEPIACVTHFRKG